MPSRAPLARLPLLLSAACGIAAAGAGPTLLATAAGEPPATTEPATSVAIPNDAADEPAAPAGPQPGAGQVSTEFERRLVELSFGEFLGADLAIGFAVSACSEPESLDPGTEIACFALTEQADLVIAKTTVSGGTGIYAWEILTEIALAGPPPAPADSSPAPTVDPAVAFADDAVLAQGAAINDGAAAFIAQYEVDPRIGGVNEYGFDPDTATVTLDVTLAPGADFAPEDLAWNNTAALAGIHWSPGSGFRTPSASLLPGLTIVVDGETFTSPFGVMTRVADGVLTMETWLPLATAAAP